MKQVFILSGVVLSLLLGACNRCPKDVKLGTLQLSQETLDQFPYQPGQQLTFLSNNGIRKVFTVPDSKDFNVNEEISLKVTCDNESFLSPSSTSHYFEFKKKDAWMAIENGNFAISIRATITSDNPLSTAVEDTLFYEYIAYNVQFIEGDTANVIGYHNTITCDRGNDAKLPAREDRPWYMAQRTVGDTTILGIDFLGVTETVDTAPKPTYVYANKTQGLVAFVQEDKVWVLEKVE